MPFGAHNTAGIYIKSGTLTIEGDGSLTAIGGTSKGGSYGIKSFTGDVIINSGTVTAQGGTSTIFGGAGIYTYGNVTINGGVVTAKGGNVASDSYGVYADRYLRINGGVLNASCGTSERNKDLAGACVGIDICLSEGIEVTSPVNWTTCKIGGATAIANSAGSPAKETIIQDQSSPESPTLTTPEICTVTFDANGGCVGMVSKTITNGATYGELPTPTRSGYIFDGWFTSVSGGTQITSTTTVAQAKNHTLYAHWTSSVDLYNLGDETYSFCNYGDSDSVGGHCFGMSFTSAGYHNGLLDIEEIGGNADTPLYSFSKTKTVTQPICHYQNIQGSYSNRAIVAGGSFYLKGVYNISSDWKKIVDYVRNHNYDDIGALQIGFRKDNEGGHAINFLRYENVNGQDRIYAYDNNFPNQETYFYQDSAGRVWQAPVHTFSDAIDCIALRDCETYFNIVDDFDATHVLYMAENTATVQGDYTHYYMEAGSSDKEYIMYEIPENVDSVIIIPHKDNAEFVYMDTTYSFGKITNETCGKLTLVSANDGTLDMDTNFQTFEDNSAIHNSFIDVSETDWFYDAVLWAVENGITTGTSATTFSPNADCTRAQIVTFLWRANGSPEPTFSNNPFKDVEASDYYYKAVLWAVENGITNGTSSSIFSANDSCMRSQAVTFLHRAEHSPVVTGINNFTDVQSNAYYSDAVAWAVINGITNGTSSRTFSPNATCTRAQIVTFLYRNMG